MDPEIVFDRISRGERNWFAQKLSQMDFSGLDMAGFDFGNAEITWCVFNRCNLENSNFSRANLSNCSFVGATLAGSNMSQVNLSGSNLGYADLRRATLVEARVDNVNFVNADLRGTDFRVYDSEYSYKPVWQTMILKGAVFNSTTRSHVGLKNASAIKEWRLPLSLIRQKLTQPSVPLDPQEKLRFNKAADTWIQGSFYLFAAIMLLIVIALVAQVLSPETLLAAAAISTLIFFAVGVFVLRTLGDLDEKSFIELVRILLNKLPLASRPASDSIE